MHLAHKHDIGVEWHSCTQPGCNFRGKQKVDLTITHLGTKQIPEQMQQMLGGSKEVASFEASTSIDRNDYEVGVGNWAATMVVGDKIDITILLEAHRR